MCAALGLVSPNPEEARKPNGLSGFGLCYNVNLMKLIKMGHSEENIGPLVGLQLKGHAKAILIYILLWVWTTNVKIDTATWTFLKFDMGP